MALCKRFRGTGLICFLVKGILHPTKMCLGRRCSVSVPKSFQAHRHLSSTIISFERQTIEKLFACCKTNHQVTGHKWMSTTPRPVPPQPRAQREVPSGKKRATKSTLYYIAALGVATLGLSYAAVPLYRIFCQVLPGETALAFYTARNPTDRPVIGVSTYNVIPFDAGQYFNKIQCFCFEEQLLNPHEEVHMPVFFYIDPEFVDDPKMENVDQLTLSYTFFEAREGVPIPIPNFAKY
ncbi:cytochrome c oxidase assembly protein COX11, mitochondrial isoform X3 [Macrobrachium rosenbergii]|uniref:cytochrome c oxidase assembly protein COX11, mitochondrial isoform X3 n=1 Tax=Macrobrachium rosenbergii TaxID=79674 RepID=UPI0034D58919